ncbi:STAS domain-containing protein [uncultured Streptomyces sp.]|uniref:STAS domain-containing protein n=1 Tax=uncultured Streptomyces sp. TaxID=174707 RepID=UPI002621931C|nr:STAS domain-containing protein [uncultured Streptomyces sp.]
MSDQEKTTVTCTPHEGYTLIAVRGDADEDAGAPELVRALSAAAGEGPGRTVLDLSGTTFADSVVLHALLDGREQHVRAGRRLVLAGPLKVAVRRLFEITGTADAFELAETVEAATTC